MHQYACGTEQDFAKAAGWLQQAAFQGNKYAMYSLGMLYYLGEGVKQSYENAFRLFQQSHENGNAYASYELAKMYEKGIGTEKQAEKSDSCYRTAFFGFLKMAKKSRDDNLMYRIGCMYLKGKVIYQTGAGKGKAKRRTAGWIRTNQSPAGYCKD